MDYHTKKSVSTRKYVSWNRKTSRSPIHLSNQPHYRFIKLLPSSDVYFPFRCICSTSHVFAFVRFIIFVMIYHVLAQETGVMEYSAFIESAAPSPLDIVDSHWTGRSKR